MAIFTNKATLSYRGVTAVSNTVTGELVGALTLDKTALTSTYTRGSGITYIITLLNSGSSDLTGVSVSDDLGGSVRPLDYVQGSAVWFLDGVRQDSLTVTAEDGITFSGITVPADGSSMVIYDTTVSDSAPLSVGSSIENTATAFYGTVEASASFTVTAAAEPQLTITKALSPLTVTDNGEITYTFVISNSGNLAAEEEDGAVLTDIFDPVLTDLTAALDGEELSSGDDYTYDVSTGVFSTVPGVITVPAATFETDPDGSVEVIPGTATLTVTGRIALS
ncbi:MAG: DUF11 domain-containing protein [Clostridiales bacterium]|nr:DUF11 domain-containing protein [Clostridiales bacterium]